MTEKKQRAVKVEDVSAEYGKPAWRYSDGSIRGERGVMLAPLPGGAEQITPANARDLNNKRVEQTRELLAQSIAAVSRGRLGNVGPAEAIAAAGGILWKDIVLAEAGDGVYPRDRLQAYDMLSKHAGHLTDGKQQQAVEKDDDERAIIRFLADKVRSMQAP